MSAAPTSAGARMNHTSFLAATSSGSGAAHAAPVNLSGAAGRCGSSSEELIEGKCRRRPHSGRAMARAGAVLCVALVALTESARAIYTTVGAGASKCFFEELDVDDQFVGQFEESSGQGSIDATVCSARQLAPVPLASGSR